MQKSQNDATQHVERQKRATERERPGGLVILLILHVCNTAMRCDRSVFLDSPFKAARMSAPLLPPCDCLGLPNE